MTQQETKPQPTRRIEHGDCLAVMRTLPDNSIDSIVTDPPYGLRFMGKKWDCNVPDVEVWAECLRVLKPGGHLLAFAGTRTQHRMAVRIEDAGFEIRDMLAWVYGSGFPKSLNVAKAIGSTGQWQGWGTALKPSLEPITMARKPFSSTVAANVLEHGTGALNIDGCRVPTDDNLNGGAYAQSGGRLTSGSLSPSGMNVPGKTAGIEFTQPIGRWPANLIHDGGDEVRAAFPDARGQQGDLHETGRKRPSQGRLGDMPPPKAHAARIETDASAARFFYCAKTNKADRGADNDHPTVKPTDLMRYLCRLVTPPGGVILDPFFGSGSTGRAAVLEGFGFIGIEKDDDYIVIARNRIAAVQSAACEEA